MSENLIKRNKNLIQKAGVKLGLLAMTISTLACQSNGLDLLTNQAPGYSMVRGAVGLTAIGIELFGTRPLEIALLEARRPERAFGLMAFTLIVPIVGGLIGYYSNSIGYASLAIPATIFVSWLAAKAHMFPNNNGN